jgi:cytochrome c-type biogenesis protein CcmE
MSPKKKRRLAFAIALLVAGGVAAALVIFALRDNVLFF